MEEKAKDTVDIRETDIVFDCVHCGKSLAIDYRGAGLSISCIDCGKTVEVPIPEGMDITDIDGTEEEREVKVAHLRRCLVESKSRACKLEEEIQELTKRRANLEKTRSESMYRFGVIMEQVDLIRQSLQSIAIAIENISSEANKKL